MAVTAGRSRQLCFLNTLVTIRVSCGEGEDQISVLEHLAPSGDSPPLHVHETEDEIFHILEGTLRLRVAGEELTLEAGNVFLAPKGVPHTYRVESPAGGRWLTVTTRGDFEGFVRSMARPALEPRLPDPTPPSPETIQALLEAATRYHIQLVGPSLGA